MQRTDTHDPDRVAAATAVPNGGPLSLGRRQTDRVTDAAGVRRCTARTSTTLTGERADEDGSGTQP